MSQAQSCATVHVEDATHPRCHSEPQRGISLRLPPRPPATPTSFRAERSGVEDSVLPCDAGPANERFLAAARNDSLDGGATMRYTVVLIPDPELGGCIAYVPA